MYTYVGVYQRSDITKSKDMFIFFKIQSEKSDKSFYL